MTARPGRGYVVRGLFYVVIVGALVLLMWWTGRARGAADMAMLECTNLYARANTPADSQMVDATHPTQQPRGSNSRVTCGDLR